MTPLPQLFWDALKSPGPVRPRLSSSSQGPCSETPAFDPGPGPFGEMGLVERRRPGLSLRRDSGDLTPSCHPFVRRLFRPVVSLCPHPNNRTGRPQGRLPKVVTALHNWCRSGRGKREFRATPVRSHKVRVNGCTLW